MPKRVTLNNISVFGFYFKHIKPYLYLYIIMLVASCASAIYPFAFNYIIKMFIDIISAEEGLTSIYGAIYPISAFLAMQMISNIAWRIKDFAQYKSEPYVKKSIIINSYNEIQRYGYEFFDSYGRGEIISKTKCIWEGYEGIWAQIHEGLFLDILKCMVGISVLCYVDIRIGALMLCWLVLYIPFTFFMAKILNHKSFAVGNSKHSIAEAISDKITNIYAIISNSSYDMERKELEQDLDKQFVKSQKSFYYFNFIANIISDIFYIVLFGALMFYMSHLKVIGVISVGDFALVLTSSLSIIGSIWRANHSLQRFASIIGDCRSAISIFDNKPKKIHAQNITNIDLLTKAPDIKIQNLCFSYVGANSHIFQNFDLEIKSGGYIGIVGKTGAGKTTLVKLLTRYHAPKSGCITFDKTDIRSIDTRLLRDSISIISQESLLFHKNIMDNMRYPDYSIGKSEVLKISKLVKAHDFIKKMPNGYDTLIGEKGVNLSSGQRQKIILARAILKNAKILILDEATNAIDSQTDTSIKDYLRQLKKEKTIIVISHRLSTVQNADRIILLDQGAIINDGTHESLMKNKKTPYNKMWE